ncbi:MAG: LptA/OstA family protein [bacterium]
MLRRLLLMLCLSCLCLCCATGVRAQNGGSEKPAEKPASEEQKEKLSGEKDPDKQESTEAAKQEGNTDKAVEVKLADKPASETGAEAAEAGKQAADGTTPASPAERDRAQGGQPPANSADDSTGDSVVQRSGDSSVRPVDEATPTVARPEDSASGLLSSPTDQQGGSPSGTGSTNVAEGQAPGEDNIRPLSGVETLDQRMDRGDPSQAPRDGAEAGAAVRPETPGFIADEEGSVPDDMAELDDLFDLSEFGIEGNSLNLDMTPEEFLERYEKNLEFDSLLPGTKLPEGDVPDIISRQQARPGIGLMDNYAWLSVPTGNVRGSTETKQFHMEGGVIIYFDEITISGDVADIDEKNEIAVLTGNVNIIDPKYTLKTDELRILFNEKKFQASGFVSFKKLADRNKTEPDMSLGSKDRLREYFAAREFELSCGKLFYNWETREMIAIENVRMGHPVFRGTMYRIDYDDESKEYLMSGGVKLEVEKYDWIFDNELAAPEDEQKLRALTDGKTTITCDRLAYEEASGIAKFFSSPGRQVGFEQPKRGVKAAYIEINDQTKDFYAEGSVGQVVSYNQTDGEWLFAGGLIERDEVSDDLSETMQQAMEAEALTLEYNFERKRIEMHGGVRVTAGQKLLQAGELVQDETAKFFLLRDNVLVKPDEDSSVYCAQVYVDTANDVFTFVGLVQGSFVSEDLAQATPSQGTGEVRDDIAAGAFATGSGPNVVESGR